VAVFPNPFPNPCPVCGVTDDHSAWVKRFYEAGGIGDLCPHPAQPGHGTGCCCLASSYRPVTPASPHRLHVCVILPCAGKGSRLGLPFPKELASIGPGRCVIDSSLDMIREASAATDVRVLLMTDGDRRLTVRYVRDKLPGIPVAEVVQDTDAQDMPDAVLRLEPWLSLTANILLLPDVVYSCTGGPVTGIAVKAAAFGFAFGAVKASLEGIAAAGALRITGDRVAAYEDKPGDPSRYDALWGILGFSGGQYGLDGLRVIAASTSRTAKGPLAAPVLRAAPVTWLDGFADCGTWERYSAQFLGTQTAPARSGRPLGRLHAPGG
jgi:hypothetical protein